MPMMEDLLSRLQESPPQTEDDLMGMLADTGYDIVPSEEGAEMMGDEGPEDVMEEDVMADEGGEEMGEEAEMGGDPMGLPPLPGMMEDRPSEDANPRMKMKMLVMNAAGKALKGEKGKRK